jgi:hypothetical protein
MAKRKTNQGKWTLVQHSGYAHAGKPEFACAVEEALVDRDSDLAKISQAGGLIFNSYLEASDREYEENYPPEVDGIIPKVKGTFGALQIDGRKIYIPLKEGESGGK